MEAAEKKLEHQHQEKTTRTETDQMDLMNKVLERTAILEAQASSSTAAEVLLMIENTKMLKKKQKDYKDWKELISHELDSKFKAQTEKIKTLDRKMAAQDSKLDSLLMSMASMKKSVSTENKIKSLV
eukprot:13421515-Ditylum_brightwellii.AAC.1